MTPEALRALQAEILAREDCAPYVVTNDMPKDAGYRAKDQAIADILSADGPPVYVPTRLSSLGLADKFPSLGDLPGPLYSELVLQKLEAFATACAASQSQEARLFGAQIARQMKHLEGEQGIDFGSANIHAMFDRMVLASGITEAEAAALKSVAATQRIVTPDQVSRALRGPWGDEEA